MLFIGQFRPLSAGSWALLLWWFFNTSGPAAQRDQPIKDPRHYKLGNGASGRSEDSSPLEGASSPPRLGADPHHSWSPGTESATGRAAHRGKGQGRTDVRWRKEPAFQRRAKEGHEGTSDHPSSQAMGIL